VFITPFTFSDIASNMERSFIETQLKDYSTKQSFDSQFVSEPIVQPYLPLKFNIPFPEPTDSEFTFIDLLAGIGGFRIPIQELKGKCVFSSEFNT